MNDLELLQAQVAELMAWKASREDQQITYPLDIPSRNAIGALTRFGIGSTTPTTAIILSGNPQTITVPAPYAGTLIVEAEGAKYEIPYIA